ncbi:MULTISPECIES: hypothetical protein [unclassified Acinetobacter]|uniref:hypothetical protein n=1 Tax=unclassified Acinetobacter TaxID=196816 RepID=UPI0018AC2A35|nr:MULTISPECIES: hypothetical protein [unclassified Acinetobacter]MBJ9953107.1 hypothetical protein [Acinetobacter baumannii]
MRHHFKLNPLVVALGILGTLTAPAYAHDVEQNPNSNPDSNHDQIQEQTDQNADVIRLGDIVVSAENKKKRLFALYG